MYNRLGAYIVAHTLIDLLVKHGYSQESIDEFLLSKESYTGRTQIEMELTFYGVLTNPEQLQQAVNREQQEQWRLNIENDKGLKVRLRKIDDSLCTMTTKLKREGQLGCEEVNHEITPDLWKHLLLGATDGYKKTRYRFDVENSDLQWEIDVFMGKDGQPSGWVKIDLEIPSPDALVPDFPVSLEEVIWEDSPNLQEKHREQIRNLWSNTWLRIDAGGSIDDLSNDNF